MQTRYIGIACLLTALMLAPCLGSATSVIPRPIFAVHQRMTFNGAVIYEADVDQTDPTKRQMRIDMALDGVSLPQMIVHEDHVSQWGATRSDGSELDRGWMVQYVVTDMTPSGDARMELIYMFRKPQSAEIKSEHLSVHLVPGEPSSVVTPQGTRVDVVLGLPAA